jgi:transcriptional regulator with XRE-family HTH domain
MIDKAFGRAVRKLRQQKGLSQEQLGFAADLHRTYVSQLERGLKSPSLRTICKISTILGVSLPNLMQMVVKENASPQRR